MKLIRKLEIRKENNGHKVRYGIFECPFCFQEVERRLFGGLKAKSCGCATKSFQIESSTGIVFTEERKLKIGQANKGKKRTEEQNKKQSEKAKGKPRVSEEGKRRISESKIGKPRSEETKQKVSKTRIEKGVAKGDKNPNWNNGSSFEPYGIEFNKEKKQFILERDNYKCQDPNCESAENLHIHHIDYNKLNSNSENLITLCVSCHAKTNNKSKRNYYTGFYQNLMINRLIECLL